MAIHLKEFGWDKWIDQNAVSSVSQIRLDEDVDGNRVHILTAVVGGFEHHFVTKPKFFGGIDKDLVRLRDFLVGCMY